MGSIQLRVEPEFEELRHVRRTLDAWLEGNGMSEPPRAAFVFAAHEALANAIQHSGSTNLVTVRAQTAGGDIEIEISDDGNWKVPDAAPNEERGRGLPLIRLLVPESTVSSGVSGTTVRLNHLTPDPTR